MVCTTDIIDFISFSGFVFFVWVVHISHRYRMVCTSTTTYYVKKNACTCNAKIRKRAARTGRQEPESSQQGSIVPLCTSMHSIFV